MAIKEMIFKDFYTIKLFLKITTQQKQLEVHSLQVENIVIFQSSNSVSQRHSRSQQELTNTF
jgi:hypothetical protein